MKAPVLIIKKNKGATLESAFGKSKGLAHGMFLAIIGGANSAHAAGAWVRHIQENRI
ncbi:hypothetical protein GCM10007972_19980 [Iodidimonas muriae]|uniref:Uncharacterized protein n=1 Tax=Iodidimonas muriae TaxID=261467 RepID=A0ABQ2LGJ9_9PROT|nr:hypothetical protein JCM17843_12640 [Kordiimonadales bacterium JCM 17843]GGO13610.1 hypothetical protein GCM10007972_19980 [Iodidimonas muriae]